MSAIVRRLLDKLYPRSNDYTATIIGAGGSGKTTLLYLLKLGQIVQTIPSIGFNVETIDAPTTSGQPLQLTCWDVGAGCSDMKRMNKILASYTARTDAIIWVVDGSDQYSVSESVDALPLILEAVDAVRMEAGVPNNYPVLLLSHKQDLPNSIPIDNIRKAFAKALSGRMTCAFKTSANLDIQKSGLPDAFEWLRFALEHASSTRGRTAAALPAMPDQRSIPHLTEKLDSWVSKAENDSDPREFISQFHSISLPDWDHYTHIRIAFLLLTMHGRQKGKDMIFDGIQKYIAQSTQTGGRTFHVTMTYFWIQVVHLGIRNISPSTDLKSSETALPSSMADIASPDQFALFIVLNSYLADGNLWADYYSKEAMMSPAAKAGMVLPDKKPLPNLVVRDAI
ncbi:ADP-ribosylation factor [Lyophyllum atratum]|nr:ADP-ribosylation factor [Lyophyllum atratum]